MKLVVCGAWKEQRRASIPTGHYGSFMRDRQVYEGVDGEPVDMRQLSFSGWSRAERLARYGCLWANSDTDTEFEFPLLIRVLLNSVS
jgi:hypothetical protein